MAIPVTISRAVARSVIPALQKAGYRPAMALRLLKREGFVPRTRDFYADWREFREVGERRRFFERIPLNRRPPTAVMPRKASPVGGRYTYRFRALMRDELTGRERYEWKSISSDFRMTVGEAQERLVHKIDEMEYERYQTYVRGRLATVLRR